jgi:DNA-binding NarL/FixJ family response regulator
MARVVALVPDLLFGSRLQGALALAGHELDLFGDEPSLRARLGDAALPAPDVLIVDLTRQELDGVATVRSLAAAQALDSTRTLGFYAHIDPAVRERAERAGFDLVVPRSRMAREGPQLVERLAGG